MTTRDIAKQVARAARSGSSKSYKGSRPLNWYASLVVIALLGIASIVYSRYELGHKASASTNTNSKTHYAGFAFDICGKLESNLPAAPASSALAAVKGSGQLTTSADGVIKIAQAAIKKHQDTLGNFVKSYPGLILTSSTIQYPGTSALHDGEACPKGSPDAGKIGKVKIETWSSFDSSSGSPLQGNPAKAVLGNGELLSFGYLPGKATPPKPSQKIISTLLQDQSGVSPSATTPSTPGSVPVGSAPTGTVPTGTVPTSTVPTSTVPTSTVPASPPAGSTGKVPVAGTPSTGKATTSTTPITVAPPSPASSPTKK